MCLCASCKHTDSFSGKGFAEWPRGEPAGARSSAAAYAAHVRACPPIAKPYKAEVFGAPRFSSAGLVGPLQSMPTWWYAWNARNERNNKASPAVAEPARAAQACKPEQYFPEPDRQPETALIYAMPKSDPKRPPGRPPMFGEKMKKFLIALDEASLERAKKLGGEKQSVAAGIRKALARRQSG